MIVFIFLAFLRISLFAITMESLHLLIKKAFSTSLVLGFGLCAFGLILCFAVAAIVDGRLTLRRARPDRRRL